MTALWKSLQTKYKTNKTVFLASAAVIVICTIGRKYFKKKQLQNKMKAFETQSTETNKVILHIGHQWNFPAAHGSPYCSKMIAFLDCNKIPYIIDTTMPFHPYTQKMPWITYKEHHQPDSDLIMKWAAKQKELHCVNMDQHLNSEQFADLIAYKSMIEDGLIWVIRYRRAFEKHNLRIYADLSFGATVGKPKWLQSLILLALDLSGYLQNMFWIIGLSRYEKEAVYHKGEVMIESIVKKMGDNIFFFGDEITTFDLCIYGHIAGMYQLCSVLTWGDNKEIPSKLPHAKEINEYMKRIEMKCFGELRYWKDIKL